MISHGTPVGDEVPLSPVPRDTQPQLLVRPPTVLSLPLETVTDRDRYKSGCDCAAAVALAPRQDLSAVPVELIAVRRATRGVSERSTRSLPIPCLTSIYV